MEKILGYGGRKVGCQGSGAIEATRRVVQAYRTTPFWQVQMTRSLVTVTPNATGL